VNTAEISFIVILGVMVAFYVIFIRPARQEQKRVEDTIRDLRVGDEVVTTAGFFARVKEITTPEEGPVQVILDLGNGLEVRALTSAIARRVSVEPEPAGQAREAKERPSR
jgi:preprotein translocase subunit YajC